MELKENTLNMYQDNIGFAVKYKKKVQIVLKAHDIWVAKIRIQKAWSLLASTQHWANCIGFKLLDGVYPHFVCAR